MFTAVSLWEGPFLRSREILTPPKSIRDSIRLQCAAFLAFQIMTAQPVHVFHGYLGHWYAKDGSHRVWTVLAFQGSTVPSVTEALEPEPISYRISVPKFPDLANGIPPIRMTSVIPQRIVQPPWAFGWGWPAQAIRARCSSAKCVPCP